MNAPERSVMSELLPLVLVVDDEARSLDAIRRNLDEDFTILTATGADEARALLELHEVSVILCDQRMPGLSGVAFLKEVRERWPDTVRIVISGYTDSEDIIAGINDAGIYQYILKPWAPDHLLQTVRTAAEAQALQRSAHDRAGQPAQREHGSQCQHHQQGIKNRPAFVTHQGQANQSVVAAGEADPLRCAGPHYLRKRQRQHGQIHTAAPHHRRPEYRGNHQRQTATRGQSQRQRCTPQTVR